MLRIYSTQKVGGKKGKGTSLWGNALSSYLSLRVVFFCCSNREKGRTATLSAESRRISSGEGRFSPAVGKEGFTPSSSLETPKEERPPFLLTD